VPVLLGFILGIAVTIAGAYAYDSQMGRTAKGLSPVAAGGQAPVVNWDVVSADWNKLQENVRGKAQDLERSLKAYTG
jgi:hypothetical protein